ncbi:MAG: sensor histidine kinase [Vicinamibacterales bacterium]
MAIPGHDAVAWVLKRLSGANDPAAERRRWWLVGLVLLAVLGVGMIASISMRLRRGVDALHTGLSRLEDDFEYRLPPIGGDLGSVAYAINRMAERRGALEVTLRRQDRLAALGKVVSGVAHEIRNPLNSLMLTLEVLDRRVHKGAAAGDEVRQAIDEVHRLDQILARLLAFGRPDFDNRRVQDVRPLLERALRIVDERAQRKRVSIAVHTPATDLLSADLDALAIEQILINLLLNGIDASPEGGTIKVATFADRDGLRIEVADSGDGIPADVRAQIFNPFFTTKENGTGLGLALSREMASHHGGTLEFESNGGGTTFVLRLPSRLEPV